MPIDQPPAIIEQVKPMVTADRQWSVLMSQIVHAEAEASKYRADVMNFSGALANAKSEADAAETRVLALREIMKLLREDFKRRGVQYIDDEWVE